MHMDSHTRTRIGVNAAFVRSGQHSNQVGQENRQQQVIKALGLADLFAHRLRTSDGSVEETIPLKSSVQPSPVIVTVAGVRQTPWNNCAELAVHRIT